MFKSVKMLFLGIICVLIGLAGLGAGDAAEAVPVLGFGVLCIVSWAPALEVGPVNFTLMAQALICAVLCLYATGRILDGNPSLCFRRTEIPCAAWPLALGTGFMAGYGMLAAFGLVRRD